MRTTPKPRPRAATQANPPAPIKPHPNAGRGRGFVPTIASPLRLLRDIKDKRIAPGSLSADQRRSVLAVLAHGKLTHAALAELLGVAVQTIRADMAHVRRLIGGEAKRWTGDDLVGMVLMAADTFSAAAMENGDVGLAWSIQRDLLDQLRKLGVGADPALQGGGGLKVTIETIGEGYTRTRGLLTKAMDPLLSGEVVVDATPSVPSHEEGEETCDVASSQGDDPGCVSGTADPKELDGIADEGDEVEGLATSQVRASPAAAKRARMPVLPLRTMRASEPREAPPRVVVERR